jgi:hypothetical protein
VEKESATDDSQRNHIVRKIAVAMRPTPFNRPIKKIYYAYSNLKIHKEMSPGDPNEL